MSERISPTNKEDLSQNVPYIRNHPGYPEGSQVFVNTPNGRRNLQIHSNTVKKLVEAGLTHQEIGHEIDAQEDATQERVKAYTEKQNRLFPQDDDYYETEDPLAGDVEPTGGYPEPDRDSRDVFMDSIHKQHGNL